MTFLPSSQYPEKDAMRRPHAALPVFFLVDIVVISDRKKKQAVSLQLIAEVQ
jgi:hypothetical protein